MTEASGETNTDAGNGADPAKYACRRCGSTELHGGLDTYQVYLAEGDKLSYLRSEYADPEILALYCNICGAEIEVEDFSEIEYA